MQCPDEEIDPPPFEPDNGLVYAGRDVLLNRIIANCHTAMSPATPGTRGRTSFFDLDMDLTHATPEARISTAADLVQANMHEVLHQRRPIPTLANVRF